MATSDNAEPVKMFGPGDTYLDMILADGSPLENPGLVADADKNFLIIMKDSVTCKYILN